MQKLIATIHRCPTCGTRYAERPGQAAHRCRPRPAPAAAMRLAA